MEFSFSDGYVPGEREKCSYDETRAYLKYLDLGGKLPGPATVRVSLEVQTPPWLGRAQ